MLMTNYPRVRYIPNEYFLAFMLVFAHAWLRRFDRGPVEWLWNICYRVLTGR